MADIAPTELLGFAELTGDQQQWLWTRYLKMYPRVETDAEAHRMLAETASSKEETVKSWVFRWRQQPRFAAVEARLQAGPTIEEAQRLILTIEISNAINAAMERGKLISIDWQDAAKGERLRAAKATAINQSIRTVLDYTPPSAGRKSMADMLSEDEGLMEDNIGGSGD